MVAYKWLIDWDLVGTSNSPSVITLMINMFLRLGSTAGTPLWDQEAQETLQFRFLMIALICVPLMLFPKPLLTAFLAKKQKKADNHVSLPDIKEKLLSNDENEGEIGSIK